MTEQRVVTWEEEGCRYRGKLLQFIPLHDGDKFLVLFAVVETETGYIEIVNVDYDGVELRFTHTEQGVEYE